MFTCEFVVAFIFSGLAIAMIACFTGCCWDWYASFWGRKITALERVKFSVASIGYGLIVISALAWLATFVGMMLRIMFSVIL